MKVTTDPADIQNFLVQRRRRPAVVFATYHSSDRIATAQTGKTKPFDLVICDEAHRLAGHPESLFATVLDSKKIKASKRLFLTATSRYIKDHVKRRAAELEYELVSMDDEQVFGPEFHVLTFHAAITAEPSTFGGLTDYQVVVIGVTDREAQAWAEEARWVRTASGLTTDARTLAAQIGLAKAMRKYDLRRLITFHSSVAKAARFVDATQPDSLSMASQSSIRSRNSPTISVTCVPTTACGATCVCIGSEPSQKLFAAHCGQEPRHVVALLWSAPA